MKKSKYKVLALILGGLGILCIVAFFVLNMMKKPVYNVIFDTTGGSIVASVSVVEGERIDIPSNPIRDGYDFKGWEYNNLPYDFNNVVKNDMTLVATWEKKIVEPTKYNVTLNLGDIVKSISVSEFSEINLEDLGIVDKNGYIIVWYLDGKEYDEKSALRSDITLEGKYVKIEKYTIKFNSSGGTKVKDQTVKTGETVTEPTDITKEGYVLDGWYLNSEKYDFNSKVSRSFTLVAKWIEDPNLKWYTVSFDTDGGTDIKSQKVKENTTITKPSTPTKKNFIFVDWYYKDKPFDMKSKITEDIELKAIWREPKKFQVTFQYDDGKEYMKREVLEGEKVSQPENPKKEDSEFLEWQLDGKKYNFDNIISKNITLKAKFNEKNKNCVVNFNTGAEASVINSKTIKCGETVSKPTDPIRIGYKFIVWQLNGLEYDFSSKVTTNITLNAIYEKKDCKVTFDGNGGTAASSRIVPYGTRIDNPPTSTREGHTFLGWELNGNIIDFSKTIITDDVTYKAKWSD